MVLLPMLLVGAAAALPGAQLPAEATFDMTGKDTASALYFDSPLVLGPEEGTIGVSLINHNFARVYLLNVSDPTSIARADIIAMAYGSIDYYYVEVFCMVTVEGGMLLAAERRGGTFALLGRDLYYPGSTFVDVSFSGTPFGMVTVGNILYMVTDSSILVFNITNLGFPAVVNEVPHPYSCVGRDSIAVLDNLLLISCGSGMVPFDLSSDPVNPAPLSLIHASKQQATAIKVIGDEVFLASFDGDATGSLDTFVRTSDGSFDRASSLGWSDIGESQATSISVTNDTRKIAAVSIAGAGVVLFDVDTGSPFGHVAVQPEGRSVPGQVLFRGDMLYTLIGGQTLAAVSYLKAIPPPLQGERHPLVVGILMGITLLSGLLILVYHSMPEMVDRLLSTVRRDARDRRMWSQV
ncbi:hypothetical protein DIPPA_18516 [Diplonema papillatum]|nr:hypothetical protein DIPPA_18516 [Diplonema papillatum]